MKSVKPSKRLKPKNKVNSYHDLMFEADFPPTRRVLLGQPMTALVRSEFMFARMCQIIPCNWSSTDRVHWLPIEAPLNYAVAEARNIIVHDAVTQEFEWLLFIDSDVVLPPDAFVRINEYIMDGTVPVVAGLYFAKAHPPSPLVYRGRGNGSFGNWRIGDKVWCDGHGMGCTLINTKLLREMWKDAEWYVAGGNRRVKKVFDTPFGVKQDPEKQGWDTFAGTEDLAWCNRVMAGKYLAKAGFPAIGKRKYPFLVDTGIFCKHISIDGRVYPEGFEQMEKSLQIRERG